MKKKPWKRLLWIKQSYNDNYTDPNFLLKVDEYKRYQNEPHEHSRFLSVLMDFLIFYHTLLNTSLIYVIFGYVYYFHKSPLPLTVLATSIIAVCSYKKFNIKSSIIIIFTMLTLSPVLKSLSRTTSSDSIWSLSFWLSILYILTLSTLKSTVVPTNILLSNVTVLASRLDNTTDVFCFLLICIELNILLPELELWFLQSGYFILYWFSFLITITIVYSFVTLSLDWYYTLFLSLFSVAFIFVSPWYFIYWQRYYYTGHELLTTWDAKVPVFD